MATQKIIITGGPGSGKSTLLEALKRKGYTCYDEVSRRLIKQEAERQSGILPWDNLPAFAEMVFSEMLAQHNEAEQKPGTCFFDRALPDVLGYLKNSNLPTPARYIDVINRCSYERNAFILPPWSEIFVQDSERPQTFHESVSLYHSLFDAYSEQGFRLWKVPFGTIDERIAFVEDVLEAMIEANSVPSLPK
ncbi:conserved hypothetical protein [Chloroherpeton thalassium ATCC 35110]|uniref:NadR/Ttd14 AAA domain-containing protein n=1 Tax=Chloroherpeton thalassium (strain ATCC 35110 / GB-78) TaxID=517418 RepID=B3QZ65_CHLT3|nr:AAA family ATPase [Chloroherpeton thalassium]ACF13758.1 conserved hypothetical protein [Chloroherpeton thalassium ATCC 35110]